MTLEEKEIMSLTIETAMLKGFQRFAETIESKMETKIESHKRNCVFALSGGNALSVSMAHVIKDWRTIVGIGVAIALVITTTISAYTGKPQKLTPEMVKQVVQQVQQVTNPTPVTNSK